MDASRPSYVALLDILGFRSLVESTEIEVIGQLLSDLQFEASRLKVQAIQFSDSILLYTLGDAPKDLHKIVHATAKLMGCFAAYRIGLRGGIAKGEFWHEGDLFLGKAMIRAHELEQSQDWLGGLIDPEIHQNTDPRTAEVLAQLEEEALLVRYDAPIKGGRIGAQLCIGWPNYYLEQESVDLAPPTAKLAVIRKQANTNEFLKWHRALNQ